MSAQLSLEELTASLPNHCALATGQSRTYTPHSLLVNRHDKHDGLLRPIRCAERSAHVDGPRRSGQHQSVPPFSIGSVRCEQNK